MIYKIKEVKNKTIGKAYNEGIKDFGKFFGIKLKHKLPHVCVLENRKQVDSIKGYKSERWIIGFEKNGIIYMLDNKNTEKESSHKKLSNKKYFAGMKHELCHFFYMKISGQNLKPLWLSEGVSIFLSGQLNNIKIEKKFSNFIKSYSDYKQDIYKESGTAVKLLVENFGKDKLLNLISRSSEVNNKEGFAKLFREIYNFDLNYKNFNNLLNKK